MFLKTLGDFLYNSWWLILPPIFYYIFKIIWEDFVGGYSKNSWAAAQRWSCLEVIPPREIEKGPKLMESFFQGLTAVLSTFSVLDEYTKGAFWHDRFSMEIVGEEGKIHYYIRTQKKHVPMIEAQIFAQYPDAQVLEVPDYTQKFPKVIPNKNWDLWGSDFNHIAPLPYPIKTYDKFEESITGRMIDPMAALSEVLGTFGPGEHAWLQFVLQPLSENWRKDPTQQAVLDKLTGREKAPEKFFLEHLLDVFTNLWGGLFAPVEYPGAEKKEQQPLEFRLTPGEKDVLKAVEENMGKNFFRVKMRLLIIGRKGFFNRARIAAVMGAIKQFNDNNYNQFVPENLSKTYATPPFHKERLAFRQRKIYGRYKSRNMDDVKIALSTKEMATVFHFPDMDVKAPAVPRTDSRRASAPVNLPVE